MNLDTFVDALEEEIAAKGVMAIDLKKLVPSPNSSDGFGSERSRILIEMLRVWLEHRWQAGFPITAQECLMEFPDEEFSAEEIDSLKFEEQRQQRFSQSSPKSSADLQRQSIENLPSVGDTWGEFELLGILGVGAFAKVYLARQRGLAGRLVALKLTFRQTHESEWLATLQHSAIVPIYSKHCIGQVYGLCMPFLGNTTLADLLRETPRFTSSTKFSWWSKARQKGSFGGSSVLSTIQQRHEQFDTIVKTIDKQFKTASSDRSNSKNPDEPLAQLHASGATANSPASQNLNRCDYVSAICWIGSQLADALSYAHRNGVIHSDIKPANVLLAFDGQPRLLDFNVAYKSSTEENASKDLPLGGTIPYMSPEHRKSFNQSAMVDARSDLYSLGVVLYEMLTGRLPDEKPTSQTNPSQWNSSVSPAMSAIIRKCLELDPVHRYQSADSMRDDLNAQFHHEPLVHLSEPSFLERLSKWSFRHPRMSSTVSVASVASILIAFLIASAFVRQAALNQADWVHRLDLLRQRIPNSMAMLTSLGAVPELETDVAADLQQTFRLVEEKNALSPQLDTRWRKSDGNVDEDLRSQVNQLAWLTSKRLWRDSPAIPNGLEVKSITIGEQENERRPLVLMQERKYFDAIKMLKTRVNQNPRDYVGWWLLGDCYFASHDFGNSQNAYTVCIALQPKNAIAYFNRGMTWYSASQFESSAEDYAKAYSLAPSWHWSRLNRALSLHKLGRLNEALAELDVAIDKGYATVSVYRLRGQIQAALGDSEAAKLDFMNALQCEPKTDQHWVDRGLIQLGSNPAKAAADFEKALIANSTSIDAHQKLAYVYSEILRNPDLGFEHSSRLVELAPWQPTHRAGRAVLHARAGRTNDALEDIRAIEGMAVRDPIAMYQIACVYSILSGITTLEQELQSYSKSAFRWFTLAVGADASIAKIAMTDLDVQWMREQTQFQEITKAVSMLQLTSP